LPALKGLGNPERPEAADRRNKGGCVGPERAGELGFGAQVEKTNGASLGANHSCDCICVHNTGRSYEGEPRGSRESAEFLAPNGHYRQIEDRMVFPKYKQINKLRLS